MLIINQIMERELQVSFNDLSFGLASEIFVDSFFQNGLQN